MQQITATRSESQILATNKVLRNTYALLSMTLLFSAAAAGVAMVMNMPPFNPIITLVGYFGLLFATAKTANRGLGLLFVFLPNLLVIVASFLVRDDVRRRTAREAPRLLGLGDDLLAEPAPPDYMPVTTAVLINGSGSLAWTV